MAGHVVAVAIVWLCVACTAFGQSRMSYGLFGDYSRNFHSANFQHLPGVPDCCPRYESGTGAGIGVGLFYERPILTLSDLLVRASYQPLSGILSETELTTVLVGDKPGQGAFKHTIDATLSSAMLDVLYDLRITPEFKLGAGFSAGLLLKNAFEGKEEIAQPEGAGLFLDSAGNSTQSRIRNERSGDIPGANALQFGLIARAGYALPLNKAHTRFIVPELLYTLGLTRIASGLEWKVNTIRFGVALSIAPPTLSPIVRTKEAFDTLLVEREHETARHVVLGIPREERGSEIDDGVEYITSLISRTDTLIIPIPNPPVAAIQAVGVDARGVESPVARMRIEEFSGSFMTPLLNYVFFDENSDNPAPRYHVLSEQNAPAFSLEQLRSTDKLETYPDVLNIVGKRLVDRPDATIGLTGYNADVREEKGNAQLSEQRAQHIKDYLTNVWHIAPSRISIAAKGLPERPANPQSAEGASENRRVEITASDPRILFPLIIGDTVRTSNPPSIRLHPSASPDSTVAHWTATAEQNGSVLKTFSGDGAPPSSVDWNLAGEEKSIPRFSEDVKFSLTLQDKRGRNSDASTSLPIEQVTIRRKREEKRGDTVINRFSMILFDIGSATLTPANTPLVSLIREYLKPESQVLVTGYADPSGNAASNLALAERRAKTVAAALGARRTNSQGIVKNLYDTTNPEGRLFSRTVDITILTPVPGGN